MAKLVVITLCAFFVTGVSASLDASDRIEIENAILKTIDATVLSAEVKGKISALRVRQGDRVSRGQLLGTIRDNAVRLQVDRARSALELAKRKASSDIAVRLSKKKAEVAKNELERARRSNERLPGTYSTKEIERLGLVAEAAELEVEKSKHDQNLSELEVSLVDNDLRQALDLLEQHQISASSDGEVVEVTKHVGEWVEPGGEILQIVEISRLKIEGFVLEEALQKNLLGKKAEVSLGKDMKKVEGEVVFVSPKANPINGRYRVHLEIQNEKNEFRPGMRVQAFVLTSIDE